MSELDRLDVALVHRGLATTRTRAQRLIREGSVKVNGTVVTRASHRVAPGDDILTTADLHYVSRGAHKLLGAFSAFTPWGLSSPENRDCLDIGASTGGFTQVLLENGARRVIALDVGHDQLDPRLARDPRVINMEGRNIRDVSVANLPFIPTYIVSDVSFISLTYVIPVIARICGVATRDTNDQISHEITHGDSHERGTKPSEIILLIKPQFEQGRRSALGKDGIVDDDRHRSEAKDRVIACAKECGLDVCGCVDSPITGEHGNREYLLWLRG